MFQDTKKEKRTTKKTKKNAKNRSKKALAKKNQNIKQNTKKDSKISQKKHKKIKYLKRRVLLIYLRSEVSFFTNNNENWWTGVKYFFISLQLRSEERILSR